MIRSIVHRLSLVVATVLLLLAVLFLLEPDIFTPVFDPDTVESQLAETIGLVFISLILLVGGGVAAWKGRTTKHRAAGTLTSESGQTGNGESGESTILAFDAAVESAIETDSQSQRAEVTDRLRSVAVEIIVVVDDCAPETAHASVRTGEWTDDRIVAAFLGGTNAPSTPLRWRLYAWLYDERAFRKAIGRTLKAIEQYQESYK